MTLSCFVDHFAAGFPAASGRTRQRQDVFVTGITAPSNDMREPDISE
jgi:hypothetical protein